MKGITMNSHILNLFRLMVELHLETYHTLDWNKDLRQIPWVVSHWKHKITPLLFYCNAVTNISELSARIKSTYKNLIAEFFFSKEIFEKFLEKKIFINKNL